MKRATARHVLAPILLGVLAGCVPVYRVSTADGPQAGIPFYLKSAVHRQHTTYEYPYVRLTLIATPVLAEATGTTPERLGPRNVRTRDVRVTDTSSAAIAQLQDLVATLSVSSPQRTDLSAVLKAFRSIDPLPADHLVRPSAADLRVTSNYIERVPVVDYSKVYYINGDIPPFGANSMSAELAADGTLAKGSAETSGGVGEAVSAIATALTGTFPIKEVLTAKWVPTSQDKAENAMFVGPAGRTVPFRVELAVEMQSVTFDFTRDTPTEPAGDRLARIAPNFESGRFTVRPRDKPAEQPAADGISFSGRVQLPPAKTP